MLPASTPASGDLLDLYPIYGRSALTGKVSCPRISHERSDSLAMRAVVEGTAAEEQRVPAPCVTWFPAVVAVIETALFGGEAAAPWKR